MSSALNDILDLPSHDRAPATGRENDPTLRGSYKAFEVVRARTDNMAAWGFVVRWRERSGATGRSIDREKQIPFNLLGEIDSTGSELVSFTTPYGLVHLEGENLRHFPRELMRRKVEAIQEYNPDIWDRPEAGQPIISRIMVEPLARGSARQAAAS